MKKRTQIIQFRADEDVYRRAYDRATSGGLLFPDVMRTALKAVADADVTPLADILNGANVEGEEINQAWLYQKCHDLLEYRDGKLFRKSRKGAGEEGTELYVRIRDGEEHVLIQGKHYPLKDIVWLMNKGSLDGEVIYKNPQRNNNKHSIENLWLNPTQKKQVKLVKYLNGSERIAVIELKQRAFLFDTTDDQMAKNVIENLINNGETFPLLFRGDEEWMAYRTAIHAFKLEDNHYVISIS